VRLAIMDGFLAGNTPSLASLTETLAADAAETRAAIERLAAGRAIVLEPRTRELLMAAPFSATATPFLVRAGNRSYYANCVWDALGVPAMLAGDGRASDADIETTCADCGAPLRLTVRTGRVSATPAGAVAHFAVPAARWWADIVFT
jgi:hypothetical protein